MFGFSVLCAYCHCEGGFAACGNLPICHCEAAPMAVRMCHCEGGLPPVAISCEPLH